METLGKITFLGNENNASGALIYIPKKGISSSDFGFKNGDNRIQINILKDKITLTKPKLKRNLINWKSLLKDK